MGITLQSDEWPESQHAISEGDVFTIEGDFAFWKGRWARRLHKLLVRIGALRHPPLTRYTIGKSLTAESDDGRKIQINQVG